MFEEFHQEQAPSFCEKPKKESLLAGERPMKKTESTPPRQPNSRGLIWVGLLWTLISAAWSALDSSILRFWATGGSLERAYLVSVILSSLRCSTIGVWA